jgi:phage shock protein E
MVNLKSIILALASIFMFAQCDSQNKKTEIMENSGATNTSTNQIIVDVRSIEEWNEDGHADCSVNYPLDQFASKLEELKKYDKVILVCRSGNRAGVAMSQLKGAGYTKEIENLGPWQNVTCKAN